MDFSLVMVVSSVNLFSILGWMQGVGLQKLIAESGADDDQDCEDIVYNTPDNKPPGHLRGGGGRAGAAAGGADIHKYQPVRQRQPVVVRKHTNNKPSKGGQKHKSIVEELAQYDMHGRPRPAKKKHGLRNENTYDNAGHVRVAEANSRKQQHHQQREPVSRRNNGVYERQHPNNNNNNNNNNGHGHSNQNKNRRAGGRGGGGFTSPHRSVSVPVIRILKNKAGEDHVPVATGHKKQSKSPFLCKWIYNDVRIL